MKHHNLYIIVVVAVFAALTIVFTVFPRSTFSALERRELATFPDFSFDKLKSGQYARELSAWFSDSEPFRDDFMTVSMEIKDRLAFHPDKENAITIHEDAGDNPAENAPVTPEDKFAQFQVKDGAAEKAKVASRGIIVVGSAPNARALMIYGGEKGGEGFAKTANEYKRVLGSGVNVYCMVIPAATEFYLPDQVKTKSKSMFATIQNVHSQLASDVKPVDVYTTLGKHVSEPIFLRTDHHWAPLGAFYAAEKFAQVAGVPFKPLSSYDKHVIHDFVGTMYGYSKDIALKKSPEDFVYYEPRGLKPETSCIIYKLNKDFDIIGETGPTKDTFFKKFKDGSGMAYSTFMGSDQKITKVKTGTKNGRKLIIIKDSFGNALPGHLFYSFEEIYVIDFRYFNKDMKDYVRDHGITDVLLTLNVFNAYSDHVAKRISKMLYR